MVRVVLLTIKATIFRSRTEKASVKYFRHTQLIQLGRYLSV